MLVEAYTLWMNEEGGGGGIHKVTQGDPLLTNIFNVVVDAGM